MNTPRRRFINIVSDGVHLFLRYTNYCLRIDVMHYGTRYAIIPRLASTRVNDAVTILRKIGFRDNKLNGIRAVE
jgi:hypothetical protein